MRLIIPCIIIYVVCHSVVGQTITHWESSHKDSVISYLGWYGARMTSSITKDKQFITKATEFFKDSVISYITWDGGRWSAKIKAGQFTHAKDGLWQNGFSSDIISYKTVDGSNWSAKIDKGEFLHALQGDWAKSHKSKHIHYLSWDNLPYTAELEGNYFLHAKGASGPLTRVESEINYLDYDGKRWYASLTKDGKFIHINSETGKAHYDAIIMYLTYDISLWTSKLEGSQFIHAPTTVTKEKSILEKFKIESGYPSGNTGTPNAPNITIRGVFVKEENGLLYYRPLDNLGQCTNDLASIHSNKILQRSKSGTCMNTGRMRDIYTFIIRPNR